MRNKIFQYILIICLMIKNLIIIIIIKEKKILINKKTQFNRDKSFCKNKYLPRRKKKHRDKLNKTTGFDNPIYEMIRNIYIFFQKTRAKKKKKQNFFTNFHQTYLNFIRIYISTIIISSREKFKVILKFC